MTDKTIVKSSKLSTTSSSRIEYYSGGGVATTKIFVSLVLEWKEGIKGAYIMIYIRYTCWPMVTECARMVKSNY